MKKKRGRIWNKLLVLEIFLITGTIFAILSSQSKGLFPMLKYAKTMTVEASESEDGEIKIYDSNISMSIKCGYDQYAKYGRYISVNAAIISETDDFQGWIEVISPKSGQNTAYRKEVKQKKHTENKVTIYVPIMDDSGYIQVKLLDEEHYTVLEKKIKLKIGNYEKLVYVGVLSDNQTALNYMERQGMRVFYLNKTTLPEEYYGLDLLDVLVINDYDTSSLTAEQKDAIFKWIKRGGSLVLGTGAGGDKTLKAFESNLDLKGSRKLSELSVNLCGKQEDLKKLKQEILDLEESRRIFLDNVKSRIKMVLSNGYDPIEINYSLYNKWTIDKVNRLKEEIVSKKIYDIAFAKEYETTLSQEETNLMSIKNLENGNIQLFTFDVGLKDTEVTTGLSVITAIRNSLSYTKQTQLEDEYYSTNNNYGLYDNISRGYTNNVPKAGSYIAILCIYIFLVGPVTYLILKKLDKQSLAWGVIPTLAVLFTVLIYCVGSKTRINEPYVGFLKFLNFEKGNTVDEEFYFSLTAPFNKAYSVAFDRQYEIMEMPTNNSSIYEYRKKEELNFNEPISTIQYGLGNTQIQIKNNPAFSPVYYQSNSTYNIPNKLSTKISYAGENLKGTVENDFDFDITNAVLVSDGYLVILGKLKEGGEININNKPHIFLTAKDALYSDDVLRKLSGNTEFSKNLAVRENGLGGVLTYLIENNQIWEDNKSYLFGLANNTDTLLTNQNEKVKAYKEQEFSLPSNSLLSELQSQLDTYGTTVLKFSVDVDYTRGDKEFVPTIDPYIVLEKGSYDKYYQARYLTSNDMTMDYKLPENDKVISFEFLDTIIKNNLNDNEYINYFDGIIYFKNTNTNNFDEVFRTGTNNSVTNVENYLTKDNTITVRYSTDMSLKGYQIVLPHISYWKEGTSYADN